MSITVKIGKVIKSVRVHDDVLHSFSVSKEFAFITTASREGAKLIDAESLKVIKTFKTEVPMNASCMSPLAFESKNIKFHGIIAGGVPARDAAGLKVIYKILMCT